MVVGFVDSLILGGISSERYMGYLPGRRAFGAEYCAGYWVALLRGLERSDAVVELH